MKNLILLLALTIFSTVLLAQEVETLKGQEGDWGLSINISGIINDIKIENSEDPFGNYMIFGRKYIKDDVAIRIGLSINSMRDKWNSEDSITLASGNRALQAIDSSETRFDFSVSLGYEKHMAGTKRLDPYFAAELMIGRRGNTTFETNVDIKDVTGTDKTQYTLRYDGGFIFGLGVAAGFNYFIAPKFSLGAEFGFAYMYAKVGGDYSESLVNTPVSGSQQSQFNLGKRESTANYIGVSSGASIMLSYFF
jgi:outer membrane protein with beta-barrel domain